MKLLIQILFIIAIGTRAMEAQVKEEQWDSYIAFYENGAPGSTTLRMDLIGETPFDHLPYVLVTGIKYETSRDDGFPENETFPILHKIGDELIELISKETESVLVGSFMYNKERLEYFYIKEDSGLKEKLEEFYTNNYSDYTFYVNIKEDKEWSYYREFLYPNEETLNYMADQSVLRNLQEAGDPLTKARRIDHWLYFSSESDMNKCKEELKKQNYSIQFSGTNKETSLPFELQIWRIDKIDIDSVNPITSELRKTAKKFNGEYDGWETSIEKE